MFKSIKSCVVEAIITDLQKQKKMDRLCPMFVSDTIMVDANTMFQVKLAHRGFNWYATAALSLANEDGRVIKETKLDVTIWGENNKPVPHWGRISELIRDILADRI